MIKPEQVYDDRHKEERGTLLVFELESIAKLQSLSGSPVLQVFILLQSTARVGKGFHGTLNNVNVKLRLMLLYKFIPNENAVKMGNVSIITLHFRILDMHHQRHF